MLATVLELLLAPLLVGASGLAARRWHERVAGYVSAFPAIVGPLLLVATLEHGPHFAARAATGTLLGLVALSAFAVAYAWTARRCAWAACFAAAWLAATAAGAIAGRFSDPSPFVAVLAATGSLLLASRMLPAASHVHARAVITLREIPARMGLTAVLIVALTLAASRFGPLIGGMLAALPVLASILVVTTHRRQARDAALDLLSGMVAGMTGFVVFCLLVVLLIVPAGAPVAFGVATAACLLAQTAAYLHDVGAPGAAVASE